MSIRKSISVKLKKMCPLINFLQGVRCVIVIVVRNGLSSPSSKPACGFLKIISCESLLEKSINPSLLLFNYG